MKKVKDKRFKYYISWMIEKYGITESYINQELEIWKNKFSSAKSPESDFIWSMFNRIINELPNATNDLEKINSEQRNIFVKMWEFLNEENRNAFHVMKSIHKCDLIGWQNPSCLSEVVIHAADCCDNCKELDKKSLSPELALEKEYLPNPKCTRHSCICFYSIRAIRDERGRLVVK
jgi:hypothetical protein